MFRLVHISDIHLPLHLPALPPLQVLMSKRITGYLNWKMIRRGVMKNNALTDLVDHLKAADADHIAVTGDLVNLALDAEIDRARQWLEQLGPAENVSVVPGNHDAYIRGALDRAIERWRPYLTGDTPRDDFPFPYLRQRGAVALIGVNTGIATAPFMATGLFDEAQEKATETLLQQAGQAGQFRVVMIHHPPFTNATSRHKRLVGDDRFRAMIARSGAELVLHGHTHIESFQSIEGPSNPVPVIGVPSASSAPPLTDASPDDHHGIHGTHDHREPAQYNLFDISGSVGQWACRFSQFGYPAHATATPVVEELSTRMIMENGVFVGA